MLNNPVLRSSKAPDACGSELMLALTRFVSMQRGQKSSYRRTDTTSKHFSPPGGRVPSLLRPRVLHG
jgi:hypothetical protein